MYLGRRADEAGIGVARQRDQRGYLAQVHHRQLVLSTRLGFRVRGLEFRVSGSGLGVKL